MKRLGLFVVALVFVFCTTVMAAEPAAAPEVAPAEKAAPVKAEKVKKVKKVKKAAKKAEKKVEEEAPAAPAAK
jgi:hypothetical protein